MMHDKRTMADEARALGISVSALRQRKKSAHNASLLEQSVRELAEKSPGWNPRSGAKRRIKSQ